MGLLDFLGAPAKIFIIWSVWIFLIVVTILFPIISWGFTLPAMFIWGILSLSGLLVINRDKRKIPTNKIPKGCKEIKGKITCEGV